jgi:tetratricopeptide (TPR) repeat protein
LSIHHSIHHHYTVVVIVVMMSEEQEKYDPNLVIQEANEKLQQHNDLESGSLVFQTALLTWVDDAREYSGSAAAGAASGNGNNDNNNSIMTIDLDSLKEAIATLWIAYAQYLANANQFKSAFEAYEQAVSCPVARSVGRVWLDYARFAEERGKVRKAENVYMRALVGSAASGSSSGSGGPVTDEQDVEVLWFEFLEMKRRSLNNPDLSLEELQSAIENEQFNKNKNSSATNDSPHTTTTSDDAQYDPLAAPPPAKRARMGEEVSSAKGGTMHFSASNASNKNNNIDDLPPPQRTYVVTMEAVQAQAAPFLKLLQESSSLPPDVMASWMIRDGTAPAQPPEPPLFQAAPPRLQDPTGKDILGIDLALALNQRLLTPNSGRIVLEACHGLWTMALFQEKVVHDAMQDLNTRIVQAYDARETELQNRMSVAGTAAAHAVEIMNANERQAFQQTLNQERMSVLQAMAWDFRRLLCIQQQILHKLHVPGFEDGPTVEASALVVQAKICAYLHSAFYLRNRIGEAPHVAMLTKKVKQLEQEQKDLQQLRGATHSPIPPPPPPTFQSSNSNNSNATNPMEQQQQYGYGRIMPPVQQQQQQQQPLPTYVYHGGQQQQQHVPPTYAYQQGGYMMPPQQQQQPHMMLPQQQQYVHHQHQQLPPPPPPQQQYPYYQQNR